jgi:hypothetical protein
LPTASSACWARRRRVPTPRLRSTLFAGRQCTAPDGSVKPTANGQTPHTWSHAARGVAWPGHTPRAALHGLRASSFCGWRCCVAAKECDNVNPLCGWRVGVALNRVVAEVTRSCHVVCCVVLQRYEAACHRCCS